MPEGHTIHRAARDQGAVLAGRRLRASSPQGRFAEGAARLDGRKCLAIEAFGKHLLYRFAGGETLHVHLGLFGMFRGFAQPAPAPRGAVRLRLESRDHGVDIVGPNACEILDRAAADALVARIGPDVLRADADPARAAARIARSEAPIGQLLMDQSVIAGIGNIYRTEVLWRCGVHPSIPGHRLPAADFARIWEDSCRLLARGVELGAIVTVDGAGPADGRYRERTNIFGKSECPRCEGRVRRMVIAGRKAYACPSCQPRRRPATRKVRAGA